MVFNAECCGGGGGADDGSIPLGFQCDIFLVTYLDGKCAYAFLLMGGGDDGIAIGRRDGGRLQFTFLNCRQPYLSLFMHLVAKNDMSFTS